MTSRVTTSPRYAHQATLFAEAHSLSTDSTILEVKEAGKKELLNSFPDASSSSLQRFEAAVDEILMYSLMGVVNAGSPHPLPRIIMTVPDEQSVFGLCGSRALHDNPDTFYRLVPLTATSDVAIRAPWGESTSIIIEATVLSKIWATLGHFSTEDLRGNPSNKHTIRIGSAAQSDSEFFVPVSDDVEVLLLRETLSDWSKERPTILSTQVDPSQEGDQLDSKTYWNYLIQESSRKIERAFSETVRLTRLAQQAGPNSFPAPLVSSEGGMLITQAYSIGNYSLREGEVLVINIETGGARYVVVPITSIWGISEDPIRTQSSLNTHQAVPDADGTYTFYISAVDIMRANWIDTNSLSQGCVFIRWAALPKVEDNYSGPPPSVTSRIAQLDSVIPGATSSQRVSADWRAKQKSKRVENYFKRFID